MSYAEFMVLAFALGVVAASFSRAVTASLRIKAGRG